jgi:hypothetical protein
MGLCSSFRRPSTAELVKPESRYCSGVKGKMLDSGFTRAFLALALRASFAVRARSGARSRRNDGAFIFDRVCRCFCE